MGTNTMALIQTCQIQAIMTVPHRLSFSAQLTNCKVGTCWHVELIISQHTQPSAPFFHWENWFSSIVQTLLIENSLSAGLGRIFGVACATQTNTDVQRLLFPISVGRLSQANLQQSPSAKTRMWTHGSNSDCCMTILWRQPWEELVPWERTPWHWSKHVKFRPSWLFHTGCLSLHSWQTAMLPHVGKLNSANSAFSNFHSTFIRAMGSVVLSSSFIWK